MSAAGVTPDRRYNRNRRCPICGGCEQDPRGKEQRCIGFLSDDGDYARCSREEHAGDLPVETATETYVHRLRGPCRCGKQHGESEVKGKGNGSRIVATYDYRDESGELLFQVVKKLPKKFLQRRPDGKGGWVWSLKKNGELKLDAVRRVPFRLPELLATPKSELVFIVEGEKDAEALVKLGLVATTNPGGAGKWRSEYGEHFAGRDVVIIPDVGDDKQQGEKHAADVAKALAPHVARSRVVPLTEHDASDWIAAGGTKESLLALVEAAQSPKAKTKRHIVVDGNMDEVIASSVEVASAAPEIYSRGGSLVEVIIDEPRAKFGIRRGGKIARAVEVPEVRLREILARDASWFQLNRKDEPVPAIPPEWAAKGVRARGVWPKARRLSVVVEAPTLRPDGSVLQKDGYDPDTQVYLQSSVTVVVPNEPTTAEVEAARDLLMDLVVDFPLTPEGKSVIVAAICTVVCRSAIDGSVPMFVIDANVASAGKGKLSDVVSLVALGRQVSRMPYDRDESEVRKKITSMVMAGDQFMLWDNVDVPLGCAPLDLAITAPSWKDRPMAESRAPEFDMTMVMSATGNNIQIKGDLARRVLVARLVSMLEHPELREDFVHPEIERHALEHRSELLSAVLIVMRGYFLAGRPDMGLRRMGSFEAWSLLVRSAIVWAGLPDPCATISNAQAADSGADAVRAFVESWPVFDDSAVTAGDLIDKAGVLAGWREALTGLVRPPKGERLPDLQAVGYALRGIKDRVVSGFQIVEAKSVANKKRWARLRVVPGATPPGEGPVNLETWHARERGTGYGTLCGAAGKFTSEREPNCPRCIALGSQTDKR